MENFWGCNWWDFSSVGVWDRLRRRVFLHGGHGLHGCIVAPWSHRYNFLFFDAFASVVSDRANWPNFLFFYASTLVASYWTNWTNFLFFDYTALVASSDGSDGSDGSNGSSGPYKSTAVATDGSLG